MNLPDRNKAIPLFYQLQEILHDKIEEGSWQANMRLPSEKELCEMYNVSQITVRKALKQLEIEGIIKRIQGKGTFVEDKKVKDLILQSLSGTFAFSEKGCPRHTDQFRHQHIFPGKWRTIGIFQKLFSQR